MHFSGACIANMSEFEFSIHTGADALNFSEQTKGLEPLVAMLPAKQSSDEQILAFLVDLRGRFQRWLHQDEFGPTRRQQAAALRALKKSIQALQRQLAKGAPSQREQLDAILRSGTDGSAPTLKIDRIQTSKLVSLEGDQYLRCQH